MAAKKTTAKAAATQPKVTIQDVELVLKRAAVRKGVLVNASWTQTYTGGQGTPRDHEDLDCE